MRCRIRGLGMCSVIVTSYQSIIHVGVTIRFAAINDSIVLQFRAKPNTRSEVPKVGTS